MSHRDYLSVLKVTLLQGWAVASLVVLLPHYFKSQDPNVFVASTRCCGI